LIQKDHYTTGYKSSQKNIVHTNIKKMKKV